MRAGDRVDQLPGDPHSPAGFAHRAFEDIADAKLAPDLPHIGRLAFVGKARIAGDHEQPADPAEHGDYLLDHAVDEIFLLGVAAHVLERQYRNRWFVGEREVVLHSIDLRRYRHDASLRFRNHRPDESIAAAGHGLDPTIATGELAQHPAQRRNLNREVAFLDYLSRPGGFDQRVLRNQLAGLFN